MTTTRAAAPPAAGLISLTASSARERAPQKEATLEKFPAFQRKLAAIPAAEQHLFDARHILGQVKNKKCMRATPAAVAERTKIDSERIQQASELADTTRRKRFSFLMLRFLPSLSKGAL